MFKCLLIIFFFNFINELKLKLYIFISYKIKIGKIKKLNYLKILKQIIFSYDK